MIEATAAATVPDAPIEGPQAHLSDPAPARAPHDPSDACVVQGVAGVKPPSSTIACSECTAAANGPELESALLDPRVGWTCKGNRWLCK
ncbi:MAG: hypothetical protein WC563_15655, partial [Brevundimonas sp.]